MKKSKILSVIFFSKAGFLFYFKAVIFIVQKEHFRQINNEVYLEDLGGCRGDVCVHRGHFSNIFQFKVNQFDTSY